MDRERPLTPRSRSRMWVTHSLRRFRYFIFGAVIALWLLNVAGFSIRDWLASLRDPKAVTDLLTVFISIWTPLVLIGVLVRSFWLHRKK